jgi:malonate-semialdehyde dehydrogenase (acetylating)/methylmalonate-semialdehyde dehydrogenase
MKDQNQPSTLAAQPAYTDAADVCNYVNGQISAGGGRRQDVYNPSLGKVARQLVLSTPQDVDSAVAAARAAAPGWANTTPLRRARILNKFLRLMEEHVDELARCSPMPRGKWHAVSM